MSADNLAQPRTSHATQGAQGLPVRGRHLLWTAAAAAVGFLVSLLLGNLPALPVDLYYLCYLCSVCLLFVTYARSTGLQLRWTLRRRSPTGLVLGHLAGFAMIARIAREPAAGEIAGWTLVGAVAWRGLVYGTVDGLFLSGFPWLVAWRAFQAEQAGWVRKLTASVVALIGVILVTSCYHAGYRDFRGPKLVQANLGNLAMSAPTLVSANPLASAITHAMMHTAVVVHAPDTELFLPPLRRPGSARE